MNVLYHTGKVDNNHAIGSQYQPDYYMLMLIQRGTHMSTD